MAKLKAGSSKTCFSWLVMFQFQNSFGSTVIKLSGNQIVIQWNLDLRKPDLRKNLDLRKIVGTTDFLVHKLFDLRKIF